MALGLKDYLLESKVLWSLFETSIIDHMTHGHMGYEKRPSLLLFPNSPTPLPKIDNPRLAEAKIELHEARRAGDHLDLRIKIDDQIYDYAIVKTRNLPTRTGQIQRVQRTPNHSIKYFYTDNAIFGKGEYGEGKMKTQWRGDIHLIYSDPTKIEFRIPEGQYEGRWCIRELPKGWVILKMKEPEMSWKDRMKFQVSEKKLAEIYDITDIQYKKNGNLIHPKFVLPDVIKFNNNTEYTHIAEHKIDGANYMIIPGAKENVVISRRLSVNGKPINRADNIPWLKYHKFPEEIHGKILHCELVASKGNSATTAGILNSNPNRALDYQRSNNNYITVYCWDISLAEPYGLRKENIKKIAVLTGKPNLKVWGFTEQRFLSKTLWGTDNLIKSPNDNRDSGLSPREFSEKLKAQGFEGTVIKNLQELYYQDVWLKDKKFEGIDVIIIDFQEGTGKYKDNLGALVVKDPNTGAISRIGTGFDDSLRKEIWTNREQLKGIIVTAHAHEKTHKGVMRGPRFKAFHPDSGVYIESDANLKTYLEIKK